MKHTHTPLPVYKKELTSAGINIKLVDDVIDGLKSSTIVLDCPACEKEKKTNSKPERKD